VQQEQEQEPLMAPPLEPITPQETEPAVIELKPVTPVVEEPEIAAAAAIEPELPAMAPEAPPPAPPEPEAAVPEQPLAPPPPPEPAPAPAPAPVEQAVPEIQVIAPPPPVEETPVELPAVALEPPAPELPAAPEPSFELPEIVSQPGAFRVVVRLSDGDGVEVGEFRDFGTAMQGAQEVIDQFSHSNGSWPFYAGRFIRPDLIISVDVVDAAS
jgi:hypothetical protein